jgi:hypothetical protein
MVDKPVSSQASQLFQNELPPKFNFPNQWRDWAYELFAISISISSFVSLIIALHIFDGQTQQDWKYKYFTRNTFIAAIATITRTALVTTVAISLSQNKWAWFSSSRRKFR